jgi:hypothetical protein
MPISSLVTASGGWNYVDPGLAANQIVLDSLANIDQANGITMGPTGSGADEIWTALDNITYTELLITTQLEMFTLGVAGVLSGEIRLCDSGRALTSFDTFSDISDGQPAALATIVQSTVRNSINTTGNIFRVRIAAALISVDNAFMALMGFR